MSRRGARARTVASIGEPASEHDLQVQIVTWARLASATHRELRLLHAIPNSGAGGQRGRAGWLRAEGVLAGVPDLCLPVARSGWHGLYLELKARRGRISPEQSRWHVDLVAEGYAVAVVRSFEGARSVLLDYLDGLDTRP